MLRRMRIYRNTQEIHTFHKKIEQDSLVHRFLLLVQQQ